MWKKRVLSIGILICIIFANIKIAYANENEEEEDFEIEEEINTINASLNIENEPKLNSRAAIIYSRDSKEVLWSKNQDERRKMASTTKIMSAIIILENCDIKQTVTVSKKAGGTGGSRLGLKANDKITVNDLLYGLLLKSRK